MNIVELFIGASEKYPDHIAIVDKSKSISYAQLKLEVERTASYFTRKGIKKGDRVLVFVPMSVDLYRIVLALFHCGATAVFLDEWVSKKRMELCCSIAECTGFIGITKARAYAFFSRELRQIPIKLKLRGMDSSPSSITSVSNNDSALITFTTGSTGTPKAADRTHGFLKEQFDALLDEIEPTPDDVDMPVLPIVLFMNLGIGCTSVIANFSMSKPQSMDRQFIADQVTRNKVNRITASPYFIHQLAKLTTEERPDFSSVKKIFTGGAPVFPEEASSSSEAFPNAKFTIVYGSTEAEPISSISASELIRHQNDFKHGLPVGLPYHKTQLRIISLKANDVHRLSIEEFEQLQNADGNIGEIVVSGPHVLKQYFQNEEAFKANKIIVDGTIWHRTGDSGFLLNEILYLTGRCKQLITHQNHLISPFIVEQQLQSISGIIKGTLIQKEDSLIIAIETKTLTDKIEQEIRAIGIPYNTIQVIPIPRDPRHHSKIDYAMLRRQI